MFPQLADEWLMQTQDLRNWRNFQPHDFEFLRQKYGVTWIILQQPGIAELQCPFQNQTVKVCQLT